MSDRHLPLAPVGSVLYWNGSQWEYGNQPSIGFTRFIESGSSLFDNVSDIDGLGLTSGSLSLLSGTFGPYTPWDEQSSTEYDSAETTMMFSRDILLTYVQARNASSLIIKRNTGYEYVNLVGSGEYTSGSPFVQIPGSISLRLLVENSDSNLYSDYINPYTPRFVDTEFSTIFSSGSSSSESIDGQSIMSANYIVLSGTRTSNVIPLSFFSQRIGGIKLVWTGVGNISFESRISYNGGDTWSEWTQCPGNEQQIPGVTSESDLSDVCLMTRITMTVDEETGVSPLLAEYHLEIERYHSDKHGSDDPVFVISSGSPAETFPGMMWWGNE